MKKKLLTIAIKIYTKTSYYIKYLWYLVKLLAWKMTPKRLIGTAVVVVVAIISWFSFSYIYRYVTTPKAPPLRAAPANSKYLYTAGAGAKTTGSFSAYIGENKTNSPKVEVKFGTMTTASFVLTNLNPDLKKPVKEGNKLVFANVRNQVDLSYELLSNGVKEEIILKAPIEGNAFTFDFNSQGAIPKKTFDGVLSPFFYDTSGAYVFHLAKPYAYDKKGERTDNVAYKIKKTGSDAQYQITVVVDQDWLLDPKRVYPVAIDPTVVHDTTAEFATGQLNRLIDTGSGSSPNLTTNYQELPADINTVGLWHMNETVNDTCSGGQDACDLSGNGNHGTATGTTITTTTQKLGAAARNFDGSNDVINIGSPDSLDFGNNGRFTFSGWFYPTLLDYEALYSKTVTGRTGAAYTFYTSFMSNGQLQVYSPAVGSNKVFCPAGSVVNSKWQHVAFVYDGTNITGYIDGKECGSTTFSYTDVAAHDVTIGSFYAAATTYDYNGMMDELRISNIARTPEEIKLDASRRPYSVYTSDVIDMTNVTTWNPLTWTELGVATGDGETVYSSTNLVSQWNFNSTSGTTATADAGSCGASCNGTLTNFASTASQDQAANTGWTANNKRWGVGALMFDGSNDYVNAGNNSSLTPGTSSWTAEAWIKTSQTGTRGEIMGFARADGGGDVWHLSKDTSNHAWFRYSSDAQSNLRSAAGTTTITDGNWHYIVGVRDGATVRIYVDGRQENTGTGDTGDISDASGYTSIGRIGAYDGLYFNGTIDSTRIYSRALTAAEILSNYQAGNVELQTRVGADTSPDDGSWEAWKPTTGETAIDALDNNPAPNYHTTTLLHGDGTDASTAFPDNALFPKTFTVAGNAQVDTAQSKFGGASVLFDGTGDYIDTPDHDDLTFGNADFTVDFWLKLAATGTNYNLAGQVDSSKTSAGSAFRLLITGDSIYSIIYGGSTEYQSNGISLADTNWHHVALIRSGNSLYVALDGTLSSPLSVTGVTVNNVTAKLGVGRAGEYVTSSLNGWIDEFRISKGIARWTSNFTPPTVAYDSLTQISTATDTVIKIEGTGSMKTIIGAPKVDANTVALWHMEETGGTGAYIKDSTANANNGTPTGTTVVNGFSGKARSFNGTTGDYINPNLGVNLANNYTVSAWVYLTSNTGNPGLISQTTCAAANTTEIYLGEGGGVNPTRIGVGRCNSWGPALSTGTYSLNQWTHIAVTMSSAKLATFYINGQNAGTYNLSSADTTITTEAKIGGYRSIGGTIDEFRIDNTTRTAEEIAEAYRAGRDHYINRTISSTDLSAKTTLPFYVAADRPGTYLETTAGESAFTNYQSDANTVGLWHLEEQTGTANTYLKDSSGNSNHSSTITGTTFVQGKIGKARSFNGTSDYIKYSNFTSTTQGTVSLWFKQAGGVTLVASSDEATTLYFMELTASYIYVTNNDTADYISWTAPSTNAWHHLAIVSNDTSYTVYIDGVSRPLTVSGGANNGRWFGDVANRDNITVGATKYTSIVNYFNGSIDEVRISNTARTADEIRQAYEVGLRTHPVTIDFGAKLDSGNLIADTNDLSFTVDATYYGLNSKGSNLYLGDKIIVRENYNGTEYLAQGTVTAITTSTGAVTVAAWDSGSTVPSGGFTINATVFKWQREYFDLRGSLSTHRDAITNLTLRVTDGSQGANVWLDDFRSSGGYLTTPGGSTITSSTGNRYAQYRIIETSFDPFVSSSVTSATLNYSSSLAPPTIGTPTALSATSIRWNFTDHANDETGFKVFDTSNVLKATCSTANLTYCDETGISENPNTQITRKVAVYNGGGTGDYSSTASIYTLAVAPGLPAVNTRTATTINVIPSAGSNSAGTELAIYAEEGTTCDGSGGLGYVQTGGTISGTAAWQTAAAWGTKTVTGLNQEKIYSFCVKAKNGDGVATGFGTAYSDNGGYIPISGNYIVNTTSGAGCTNRYADGTNAARYVCGVDYGTEGTNTAQMKLESGTFTVLGTETLVVGSLDMSGTGSIILSKPGAVIKPHSTLYVLDADSDGYPDNTNMYFGGTPPTNYRRKNLQSTLATVDCNPANGSYNTACGPTAYGDGHDGAVTIAAGKNINTDPIATGRTVADGEAFAVSAISTNTVTLTGTGTDGTAATSASTSLAANDEVMLINLQGDATNNGNVGVYETFTVQSVSSATVTFTTNVAGTYGVGGNSTLTGQKIVLQRVPNYTNVTVNSGITLTANAWDGTYGGMVAFKANGTVTVTGSISTTAKGYRGGSRGTGGIQGESYKGSGSVSIAANGGGGGGGCHILYSGYYNGGGGGGGGYGATGSTSSSINGNCTDVGGSSYGIANLSTLFLGSGGGGGGDGCAGSGGSGAAGGGIVFISSSALTVSGSIVTNGNTGSSASGGTGNCGAAGGGGGSGGSIRITTNNSATLGTNLLTTTAGSGGAGSLGDPGAAGAVGRIAVSGTATGTTNPTYTSF